MSELPKRKNIRLKDFDYSSNASYYITISTQDRVELFGEVDYVDVGAGLVSARMNKNHAGNMIEAVYMDVISLFNDVFSEKFIVMPNHFHCIITMDRADTRSAPTTTTICNVVQAFKSKTTVEYIKGVKSKLYPSFNKRLWQRNYYEHIIRDEKDYLTKWNYIDINPAKWKEDEYYTS
jgi:REP element-mobilizing transposase RayT